MGLKIYNAYACVDACFVGLWHDIILLKLRVVGISWNRCEKHQLRDCILICTQEHRRDARLGRREQMCAHAICDDWSLSGLAHI